MITLSTVSNALKDFYLMPMREDINMKADAFASRILRTSDNITGYNSIVRAAQIGANGGAGAGTETGALPSAGENLYEKMTSTTKNFYGSLEISDKIMKSATGANAGSFVNALERDITTLLKTLRWNLARQVYGDGSGKLMLVKESTSSTTLEAKTGDSAKFLLPGLKIDVHDGSAGTVAEGESGLRIMDVDHATNKIIVSSALSATADDYLTMQGSAGYELTGLGKIFETLSGGETLYGKTRANYSWLRPYLNASFGAINEVGMQTVINLLEDSYNVTIDHINCGNSAYGYYMTLMNNRRAINDVMILEGGHKALKFNGMPLTRCPYMPDASIDMYDTSLFTMDQVADWMWIEGATREILQQKVGYPTYVATITKYCDMMCVLPGGLARLSGVATPST